MSGNDSFEERKTRWMVLSEQIEKEIAEHKNEATFVPDVYRSWRMAGLTASEITPEMCHCSSE